LQIAIKGDAKEEYPKLKRLWIFYKIKKSIFNLVTGMRGKRL
jgi:hypothetical protein